MKIGFYVPGHEHLSVELLSAVLKQHGHATEAFFDPRLFRDGPLAHPRVAEWMNAEDRLAEEIANARLDLLCFSVVTDNYATSLRVAAKVKQRSNIPIVFGGVHCTAVPERVAVKPQVDYVVVGEGEETLVELCQAVSCGGPDSVIGNLWYRNRNREIISGPWRPLIPDLDDLPFIDKDIFYSKAPSYHRKRYITIASRGCIHSCTYCNNSMYRKIYERAELGKWRRRRSVASLMRELTEAYSEYPFENVLFLDELFLDERPWLEEFCESYGRLIGKPYWCYGHSRYLTPEVVRMLEQSGCREINIGVQTIWEETRRNYLKRGDTNRQIVDAIDAIRDSSIFLGVGNILDLPGQSTEEMLDLAAFYTEHRVDQPIVSFLRYYPKTEIIDIALKEGLLCPEQVEKIEEAEEEGTPCYVSDIDERTSISSKIRVLILMTSWAPRVVLRTLIQRGLWKRLPVSGVLNKALTGVGALNRMLRKKRGVPFYAGTFPQRAVITAKECWRKWRWRRRQAHFAKKN